MIIVKPKKKITLPKRLLKSGIGGLEDNACMSYYVALPKRLYRRSGSGGVGRYYDPSRSPLLHRSSQEATAKARDWRGWEILCLLTRITPWEVTSKAEVGNWFAVWQVNDWDQWCSLRRMTQMYQQVCKTYNAGPLTKQQRTLVCPSSSTPLRSLWYRWPSSLSLLGLFCQMNWSEEYEIENVIWHCGSPTSHSFLIWWKEY